ncbi:oxidoreductase [Pontibacter sp. G13]|uniref:oxidoreductase n=1 Tax=Pontibacter sp. G13 TaxID=3074898 RepID=UPI00288A74CE|nr:oxidoreductase [Pontibacter sp. G13]WNJ17966.1 oxidoreductase [Pontibacter sp. G13]
MAKSAWVFGATGLIGGHVTRILSQDDRYSAIHIFSRRPVQLAFPKVTVHVIDFDHLPKGLPEAPPADIYCCLGTTIKKAGSQERFLRVDKQIPLQIANYAAGQQVPNYLIVTAMGAKADSPIFYNRVKGETEEGLKALHLPYLGIARPALLLGARDENRPGEAVAQSIFKAINPLMIGPLKSVKAIPGEVVAQAMIEMANQATPASNVEIVENAELWDLGESAIS